MGFGSVFILSCIPFILIAFFTGYCYWKMIGIATNKKYFDDIPGSIMDPSTQWKSLEKLDRFKSITDNLNDINLQKKYNRIYYGFIVGVIFTPILMVLCGFLAIFLHSNYFQ